MATEATAQSGFARRFAAKAKGFKASLLVCMVGLVTSCVEPSVKEVDHDDEYADELLETRNLLHFRDIEHAKQKFDKNKATGQKSSFKSWLKESYSKACGKRSSSSSLVYSDSAESDRETRMSDSSGVTALDSDLSTKSDNGKKASTIENSSAGSRMQSVSGSLGQLSLLGINKAADDVVSPRSVYSMATTAAEDKYDMPQNRADVDIDTKMQLFFESYASEALVAVNGFEL